ncbi:hypothetical protein [Enterococcus sp. DIV0996a]|uniref:hypothetical protein n=1 Tax=Enterococcus sp. DIV0996a TaxID=2774790 RepID=UPI003F24337D
MDKEKNLLFDKKSYINSFSTLNSNKFSKDQSISLFFGTLFMLLSDKDIFKKNSDIKLFLDVVLKKEYKDYLFRSRPYLISRVLNDVRKGMSYSELIILSSTISTFLNKDYNLEKVDNKKINKGRVEDNIVSWMNQLNGK